MKNEFIPYEQALALKQLGFDEPCFAYYDMAQEFNFPGCAMHNRNFINLKATMTPLYQQAFRWFREKYELNSWVYNSHMDKYFYTILQDGRIVKATGSATTYEEAELACLEKLIEIVELKQQEQ